MSIELNIVNNPAGQTAPGELGLQNDPAGRDAACPTARQSLQTAALLAPDETVIGDIVMRPVSLQTFMILSAMGNNILDFNTEKTAEKINFGQTVEMLWALCAPENEVIETVSLDDILRPAAIKRAVLKWAAGVPMATLEKLSAKMAGDVASLASSAVTTIPDPGLPPSQNPN